MLEYVTKLDGKDGKWNQEVTTDKNCSGQHCCEAETKELYSHVTLGQETLYPSWQGLAGLHISKDNTA